MPISQAARRSAWLVLVPCVLLLTGPIARADDPPKPLAPQAALAGPILGTVAPGYPVFLDASGSVTDYPIEWSVNPVTPLLKLDQDGRKRVYGLLPNLSPDTDYLVTVVALGKDAAGNPTGSAQTVKFSTKALTPVPPVVTPPVVTPPPTTADLLGLTGWTRSTLKGLNWSAEALRWRQTTLAPVFSDVAAKIATYSTGQAAIIDLEARYKAAIGPDLWPWYQANLFAPLQAQLVALMRAGKLKDNAALAEAFTEIANALKEGG